MFVRCRGAAQTIQQVSRAVAGQSAAAAPIKNFHTAAGQLHQREKQMEIEQAISQAAKDLQVSAETSRLLGMFKPEKQDEIFGVELASETNAVLSAIGMDESSSTGAEADPLGALRGTSFVDDVGESFTITDEPQVTYRRTGVTERSSVSRVIRDDIDAMQLGQQDLRKFERHNKDYAPRDMLTDMEADEAGLMAGKSLIELGNVLQMDMYKETKSPTERFTSEKLRANEERVKLAQENSPSTLGVSKGDKGSPAILEPYQYGSYTQMERKKMIHTRSQMLNVAVESSVSSKAGTTTFLTNKAALNSRNNLAVGRADGQKLPSTADQVEGIMHAAVRTSDADPLGRTIARNYILGDSDPANKNREVVIDPTFEALHSYINYAAETKRDDPQLWDSNRLKSVWFSLVAPSENLAQQNKNQLTFANQEEFFATLKDMVGRNASGEEVESELMRRMKIMFPSHSEGALKTILGRLLEGIFNTGHRTSKEEKRRAAYKIDGKQWAIQSITDDITQNDDAKPDYLKWSEMVSAPKPKLAAVFDSVNAMARNKIKERQWYAVAENMKLNDPRLATNPLQATYDNLRPIHDPSEKIGGEDTSKKIYEPEIVNGVSSAVGKRKSSIAQVSITPGNGLFTINGRDYLEYFPSPLHKVKLGFPMSLVDTIGQFDIKVNVKGGGHTGQVDAIVSGIVKAFAKFVPEFGYLFTKYGFMRRDPRVVERKKPGRMKARRSFQWVKR